MINIDFKIAAHALLGAAAGAVIGGITGAIVRLGNPMAINGTIEGAVSGAISGAITAQNKSRIVEAFGITAAICAGYAAGTALHETYNASLPIAALSALQGWFGVRQLVLVNKLD